LARCGHGYERAAYNAAIVRRVARQKNAQELSIDATITKIYLSGRLIERQDGTAPVPEIDPGK